MARELIPLFPLSVVLMPAMPLPLHIFEERYKEMMGEVIPAEAEFGVVLAKDGGIVNVGCTAVVDRVLERYPDGRLDLVATGRRRFHIESLDQEKSYLRAEVEYFNDEDATEVSADLRLKALAAYKKLREIESNPDLEQPDFERGRASFALAQLISDLDKRQTILGLRSEIERLEFIIKIIPEYLIRQQRIALANRVGPSNGHAKTIP